jgi:hypothetical protein
MFDKLFIWIKNHYKTNINFIKNPIRAWQQTHSTSMTVTTQLTLYGEINVICSAIHKNHRNAPCGDIRYNFWKLNTVGHKKAVSLKGNEEEGVLIRIL